jgi:hypothetical protein
MRCERSLSRIPPIVRCQSSDMTKLLGVYLIMTRICSEVWGYRWLEADSLEERPIESVAVCCLSTAFDVWIGQTAPCENQTMPEGFAYDPLCLRARLYCISDAFEYETRRD